MKELFEIDLKGNQGSSIKYIHSFSKQVKVIDGVMDLQEVVYYKIDIEYHNGDREILEFEKCFPESF